MSLPISGFMPIPLAIMPPFMAYQSLVMGDAFGRAFQFGKRKISAMSNDEFNKLDIVTMFESISNEYTRMIPSVEKAMSQSLELQVTIVKELLKTLPAIGQMLNELGVSATGKTLDELAHLIGMHFGHGEQGTPIPPTPGPQPSPTTPPVQVPPQGELTVTWRGTQFTQSQWNQQLNDMEDQLQKMFEEAMRESSNSQARSQRLESWRIHERNFYTPFVSLGRQVGWKPPPHAHHMRNPRT